VLSGQQLGERRVVALQLGRPPLGGRRRRRQLLGLRTMGLQGGASSSTFWFEMHAMARARPACRCLPSTLSATQLQQGRRQAGFWKSV
jgi:hypothetical protein